MKKIDEKNQPLGDLTQTEAALESNSKKRQEDSSLFQKISQKSEIDCDHSITEEELLYRQVGHSRAQQADKRESGMGLGPILFTPHPISSGSVMFYLPCWIFIFRTL